MRVRIKVRRKQKRNVREQGGWPTAYRWAAMGTMVAYSAVGGRVAQAQPVQNQPQSGGAARQTQGQPPESLPAVRFEIPAGALGAVLETYRQAIGLSVSVAKEGILMLASPGVSGMYTPERALQKLLDGTGIVYRFTAADAVSLDVASVAASVDVVTSVEALAASSPKFATAELDAPRTISEVPRQLMDAQGTTTLRDALRNVAGISLAAGEGGAQGDNLTIRGFAARNDLYIDGMRDFGSYYRDPFNLQEVEVLQGPSSVTFGRGSTGGVVNQATKTPGLSSFISGDADFGTDLTRRISLDIDEPLRKLGPGAAFRLNLMGDEGNVAERNVAENRRFGVAPSLALGLGTPTRWNFGYVHQTADDIPDYGIPWLFNGPAPVNRTNYYGFQNGNYLRTYDDIVTAKVEHDVNRRITIRNQARFANYVRDALITEAQIATPIALSTPLSAMAINRNEIGVNSVESYLDDQVDMTAKFETGFLRHTFISGIEAGRETSDPTRPKYTGVPTTSLLNPDPTQAFTGVPTISSAVNTTAWSQSAYALDSIQFGKRWIASGGLRWDRFDTNYTQSIAPATAFSRVDEMPSWRAALVYKPVSIGSIYFDAGTSFNPSAESLSLSASTANLPPEKNRTFEFGTKWDFAHNRISIRSAIFRTLKFNAREPDPNNSLLNVLAGTQRVNGAQVEVRGRLTNRWEMLASYANLDAREVSSNYYPAAIGAQLANVPRNTFNFWTSYRLPKRWEVGTGGNYASSRTASSTAPFDPTTGLVKEVPGYWVFNGMIEHRVSEHVTLQANVNNIANRYYYDQLHPAHIILGPGRSALIGLKFKF